MLILLLIIKIITVPFGILFEFTIGNLQSFEDPNLIFYPFQNIISYHLNSLRINFSAKKHCLLMRNQHVETHVKAKSQTIRCPVPSTDQAIPSCFHFRISWILMEQCCFYFFCPLGFLEGLRSFKHWLLQKVSMKNSEQKFKFLIKK